MPRSESGLDLVRHMQYFLAVADHQNFGRAARALGITQPPLSQGIRRLESQLGLTLFDRRGGVRLTPEGDSLLPRARTLVDAADAIVAVGVRPRTGLRLGLVPQVPAHHAALVIRSLHGSAAAHPLPIMTSGSVDLVDRVAGRELDAAVVVHPMVLDAVGVQPGVIRLRTWALLPEHHPLAGRREVALTDLAGTPVVTAPRSDNPAAFELLRDVLGAAGLTIASRHAADDRSAMLEVVAGRCAALTADGGLAGPGFSRVRLAGDPVPLRLRVIWRAGERHALDPEVRRSILDALTSRRR